MSTRFVVDDMEHTFFYWPDFAGKKIGDFMGDGNYRIVDIQHGAAEVEILPRASDDQSKNKGKEQNLTRLMM